MDPKAISKCKNRLRSAGRALDAIENAKSYDDLSDSWYFFISAWKGIYTILEQGAKISPQSRQWFGAKKKVRRNDPLLQYIYQARNDDEHGLNTATELAPGYIRINVSKPGEGGNLSVDEVRIDKGRITVRGAKRDDGKPVCHEIRGPHAVLVPVRDRGGKTYAPPSMHMGHRLPDREPLTIAKAAYSYATALLSEAETYS